MSNEEAERKYRDGLDLIIPTVRERLGEIYLVREELEKESDRGCALVAAAYLENELSALLSGFFVKQSKSAIKQLFEFNGPVGTFSAKIKLSYSLGLISAEVRSSLDILRDIRNKCAHLQKPLSFESDGINHQVDAMMPSYPIQHVTRREAFIGKVQAVTAVLHTRIAATHHREEPPHESVNVASSIEEYELDIAARHLMSITAPDITYEEALELAKDIKQIN